MKIIGNINFDNIDFSEYKKEIDEINNGVEELKKNELLIKKIKEGETMKIIDLLNIIANSKEKPKKIKYKGIIYEYKNLITGKGYVFERNSCPEWFLNLLDLEDINVLNDEIEIIEEEKEIEELGYTYINSYGNISRHKKSEETIIDKINELVREIKKLKKEGKLNESND